MLILALKIKGLDHFGDQPNKKTHPNFELKKTRKNNMFCQKIPYFDQKTANFDQKTANFD